ncbi:MAG: tRNA (adenosine(37)-N6)-dimethylallyltransferase MiaA [Clostridia bacterium]|nr:tRNA (adenosine(37)-N6)-dimethylallyltransferase MiaA [Clostridia bacterium]
MEKIKTVFVVGPTACGKTGLGIEIANKFDGEIISADSMQIYKGMSIASASPTKEEQARATHHLVEFVEYGESYTVADYVAVAKKKILEINGKGKLPIVVGGTGLYINSLADNIEFSKEQTDFKLRERLEQEMEEKGGEKMLELLSEIDCETARTLHPNNKRRILRALEIYYLTGVTKSKQDIISKQNESFIKPVMIGITYRDRQLLYKKIEKRIDLMIENGLVDEARTAYNKFGGSFTGAVQAIGHKELFGYFNGESTLEESVEILKRSTRRYAKRQMTWFSKDERIHWIYADETSDIFYQASKVLREELS